MTQRFLFPLSHELNHYPLPLLLLLVDGYPFGNYYGNRSVIHEVRHAHPQSR